MKINVGEEAFLCHCALFKLPKPEREYRFHPTRKWRLDFAWPSLKTGVEIQGGIWSRGKHGRGSGIVKDHEKQNALMDMGWKLYLFTPQEAKNGIAAKRILETLGRGT